MLNKYQIIIRYSLYAIITITYLSTLQVLLVQQIIGYEWFVLLIIPLVVSAYLFNVGKITSEKKLNQNQVELSARETEVSISVAQGITNKQIAEQLFISENTVKTHIKNILFKLKLKNRTQIAQWYYENLHHPKG